MIHCKLEMLRKNYKQHLKRAHPRENSNDLTPFGQSKVSDVFKSPSTPKEQVEYDSEEEDNNNKKRKHPSGESADSGHGETEFLEELGPSSSKHLKVNEVSLETLDGKMDLLLKGMEDLKNEKHEPPAKKITVEESIDEEPGLNFIKHYRSMAEILSSGFSYDEDDSMVKCSVCDQVTASSGKFFYDANEGLEFDDDEYLPRNFTNLKKSIVKHIKNSKSHTNALKDVAEKEKAVNKIINKNRQAGLNLGRACMKNYLLGRPYTDFEMDVLIMKKSGAVVGELNHSRKFPAALRPYVCKVVHRRVNKFLGTPLIPTGHLPPVGLSADKGTYKKRGRQFLSGITIIPGGNNLLEVFTCGQPVVTDGSGGLELAKNMKRGFDDYGIRAGQIESCVFDGVYFYCSIEEHITFLYDLKTGQVVNTWDPLH